MRLFFVTSKIVLLEKIFKKRDLMKKLRLINGYTTFLHVAFLLFSLQVQALDQDKIHISDIELHEMIENNDLKYIYLGKDNNNLYHVISQISALDHDEDSIINELKRHIDEGFSIGLYDFVVDALGYAGEILQENAAKIDANKIRKISDFLEGVMNQIINEEFTVNSHKIIGMPELSASFEVPAFFDDSDSDITRQRPRHPFFKRAFVKHGKNVLKFKDKVDFLNNVKFKEDVKFEDEVTFEDKVEFEHFVKFEGKVKFEEDVEIEGTLTVTDLVVLSCIDHLCVNELTIGEIVILSCLDNLCVRTLSVTDLVVLSCIDHLCVNNLSVVNETVSNLTVTDLVVLSCIDNLCVNNLSVVNETVSNLTVTDLVVLSCIDNLCVNNLSVGDLVASNADILCDLTVGCNISMNDSLSPAIGNIIKGGFSFMQNFGVDNTFLGINAGNFTMTGSENVGIGRQALSSETSGADNVAVGAFALPGNTSGTNDVAVGAFALVNNTIGSENSALGSFTLASNTGGSGNVAVGFDAGFSLTTGDNNTLVGSNAGAFMTTGSTNLMLGFNAGITFVTGSDNIYIAHPGVPAESGTIRIGTPATQTTAFMQGIFGVPVGLTGITVFVDAAGQLGTVVSSRKFKHSIEDMDHIDSENIYKLRPVTFVYNNDESHEKQYGLIAEEVETVFPALVVRDEKGAPYTVRYHLLPMLLLNEVQKLNNIVQDQTITINELKEDSKKFGAIMQGFIESISMLNRQ